MRLLSRCATAAAIPANNDAQNARLARLLRCIRELSRRPRFYASMRTYSDGGCFRFLRVSQCRVRRRRTTDDARRSALRISRTEWAGASLGVLAGKRLQVDFAVFTEEERRSGTGFNFGAARRADPKVRGTELHGLSAFVLNDDGVVYHTYSCYDRGTDVLHGTWQLLDRAPKGRGDDFENWPRRHDEY